VEQAAGLLAEAARLGLLPLAPAW